MPSPSEAAKKANTDAIRDFLNAGGDPNQQDEYGWTKLMIAVADGHTDSVRLLLASGADATLHCQSGTALTLAASRGHTDCVVALLDAGVDPNTRDRYGSSALSLATSGGHTAIVDALLAHGAEEFHRVDRSRE